MLWTIDFATLFGYILAFEYVYIVACTLILPNEKLFVRYPYMKSLFIYQIFSFIFIIIKCTLTTVLNTTFYDAFNLIQLAILVCCYGFANFFIKKNILEKINSSKQKTNTFFIKLYMYLLLYFSIFLGAFQIFAASTHLIEAKKAYGNDTLQGPFLEFGHLIFFTLMIGFSYKTNQTEIQEIRRSSLTSLNSIGVKTSRVASINSVSVKTTRVASETKIDNLSKKSEIRIAIHS